MVGDVALSVMPIWLSCLLVRFRGNLHGLLAIASGLEKVAAVIGAATVGSSEWLGGIAQCRLSGGLLEGRLVVGCRRGDFVGGA